MSTVSKPEPGALNVPTFHLHQPTPVRPPRRFECGPTEYFIGDSDNEHINDKELPSVPDFPFGKSVAAAAVRLSQPLHFVPLLLTPLEVQQVQEFIAGLISKRESST